MRRSEIIQRINFKKNGLAFSAEEFGVSPDQLSISIFQDLARFYKRMLILQDDASNVILVRFLKVCFGRALLLLVLMCASSFILRRNCWYNSCVYFKRQSEGNLHKMKDYLF